MVTKKRADTSNIITQGVGRPKYLDKYINNDFGVIAYLIPRSNLNKKFIEPETLELRHNCIYFLLSTAADKHYAYVGQAAIRSNGESVLARLNEHINSAEPYNSKWDTALVFTGRNKGDWTSETICALEHIFYKEINSTSLLNSQKPTAKCSQEELVKHDEKVRQIKVYIDAIGYSLFSDSEDLSTDTITITTQNSDADNEMDFIYSGLANIPEVITPKRVVNQMIDMLPNEVWNDSTKFLDPACKGGEYLYAIYRKLMGTPSVIANHPDNVERSIHILQNQIYGIALSNVSLNRTKTKLYGFENNIKIIDNYSIRLKNPSANISDMDGKNGLTLAEEIARVFNMRIDNMKFDVIIGNPPYNETNDSGSSESLNVRFVDLALSIKARYIAYIMPNRWFLSTDSLNASCRKALIGKIRYIRDFEDASEVFNKVSIAGGVSYFLYDEEYNGKMKYDDGKNSVNILHNEKFLVRGVAGNILYNKVKAVSKEYMDADWISTLYFGLKRSVEGVSKATPDKYIKLISSRTDTYLSLDEIPKNKGSISKYKVVIPYSAMEPKPFVIGPNEVCTLTYLVVGVFDNQTEAMNCKQYLETNFFKVLFRSIKTKLGTTKENFATVPIQDFTSTSDIDWTQSITAITKQLYAKYNLTQDEIDYIESTIK